MSTDPLIKELTEILIRSESVEAVQAAIVRIEELSGDPKLWLDVTMLLRRAFGCLQELTAAHPEWASSVLINDLLPRCLLPDKEEDGHRWPPYQNLFGEWLEDLPGYHRQQIRQVALPRAILALEGPSVRNALRLIASIGYWDDELLKRLDQFITSHDDVTGDQALSVRASLTPTPEPAAWLLGDLHRRLVRGISLQLLTAARAIGVPETAEKIWLHWLAPLLLPGASAASALLFDSTLKLLAQLAARSHDDAISEQVWSWLSLLVQGLHDSAARYLALNSGLGPRINFAGVVPGLLQYAKGSTSHKRCLYYRLLRECAQPAHMAGWDTIAPTDLDEARADARMYSGATDRSRTMELDQKEAAWDVLLCQGDRSVLPPFADALAGERSGYVLNQLLNLAGCLALPSLPSEVSELLAAAPGRGGWSEQQRLVAQIGAIRAAHGAASPEAFEALLSYRQVGGGVLLSLLDALADAATAVLGTGDRSAVIRLFQAAEGAPREDTRAAAAGALALLLERGHLTAAGVIRAAALTAAPATDPYACRELLFAFTSHPPNDVPATLLAYATALLDQPSADQNADPRPAALALLARQPNSRSDTDFLTRRLGLEVNAEGVAINSTILDGVVPHVVGRYFVAEQDRFGLAVASILSKGGTAALARLLPSIREAGSKSPPVVVEALVTRLQKMEEGRVAELPLIHALAAVAPDRLLADACSGTGAWLPQARAELADTLGRLPPLPDALTIPRFDLLHRLALDGIYAVRRAAYRAAAESAPGLLVKLIRGWAQWREADREGPRRRAAECAGWLPPDVLQSIRELGWDQEPSVREAFQRSMIEREERERCREYEKRVLAVHAPGEVIRAWRYGVALAQVGDDTTLHRLADRLRDDLPPSVRFWLSRVRNAVERRWSHVTEEWPDPWFARSGHLETFTGMIHIEDRVAPTSGTLWLVHEELPSGLSSWGGWATSAGLGLDDRQTELLIPGRRPVQIIVDSFEFPAGDLVFTGTGPYPEPIP